MGPPLAEPTPIYEALLVLANPSERQAILDAGEPEWLSARLRYGDGSASSRPRARLAYAAIYEILERVIADPSLRVTGIDTRLLPPRRDDIDGELLRSGHLCWTEKGYLLSELQFDWGSEELVRINGLRIEPVLAPAQSFYSRPMQPPSAESEAAPSASAAPALLDPRERKNDAERLREMRVLINQGMPRKTAARRVAARLPDPPTSEESLTDRLVRKWKTKR